MASAKPQGIGVYCRNHPDRRAIGVCVMTQVPICAECSTRYEGVNYSRQGLAMLKARRAGGERAQGRGPAAALLSVLATPLLMYLLYQFYIFTAGSLLAMLR